MRNSLLNIQVKKVTDDHSFITEDKLAVEEPLEIQLQYRDVGNVLTKSVSVTMRTPGNDKELATGFLFTEGIISQASLVVNTVSKGDTNIITVVLGDDVQPALHKTERNFYTTSSCGVCGKASIDAIKTVSPFPASEDHLCVDVSLFYGLQQTLKSHQHIFENTGGLHASALFDLQANLLYVREDVGRHNALDKLIGHAFLHNHLPLNNHILLLSGRASFELIQKAIMAGIKMIAAIGAPSSLAVQMAEEAGITLIGFLKHDRFNIYTGWQRINTAAKMGQTIKTVM